MIEEKIKNIIIEKYGSIRQFAQNINLPNSTLDSIFKRGFDNSVTSNIVKICKELNISVEKLLNEHIVYTNIEDSCININKYIAEKLRYYRIKRNITQQELGTYLGITSQTVSRYENEILDISPEMLFKLAEYFKISINDFFPMPYMDNSKNIKIVSDKDEIMKLFGNNLKNARIKLGLNQKELAERISKKGKRVGNTTISNWEKGITTPDVDNIAIICKLLNVDANYLLDLKKFEDTEPNLLNKYQVLFDKDDRLTEEQKKFFMDFLEEKHKRIDEKEEKGS